MKQPTILFNTGFALVHVIARIREAQKPGEIFNLILSHKHWPQQAHAADVFALEPAGLDEAGYVQHFLELARRHAVDVFVPSTRLQGLARARERFKTAGVRMILAAGPDTLGLLRDKAELYSALPADLVPLPEFKLVSDLSAFREACVELAGKYDTICFKPVAGIAGRGFRIVCASGAGFAGPVNGDHPPLTQAEAEQYVGGRALFPRLMVMPYMTGLERSVDCLATDGRLVRSLVRLKYRDGLSELIEDNPYLHDLASRLTEHLKLDGLYNVQFMEHEGRQFLLEINARMSGGIHYGALSGVCLPYWAIRLALGTATESDIPHPRSGLRIDRAARTLIM